MDHNLHHPPLHWGYSSTPPQNPWVPPQNRPLKRALSESDCDELYSEESSKDQTSPGDSDSCQLLSRKKRRGVIEKKRRDRINSSLSELKRLVPTAYEKQGSAKLEKAEILQLTVDHLKSLHAKGLDSIAYDPQRFAMDYHIIGFRECASEVARYLVTTEGMDIQNPLRLRLMSHLQYFVQQREISAKAGTSPNWSSGSYQPNYTPLTTAYQAPYTSQSSSNTYVPNLPPPLQPYPSAINVPPTSMHHHTIPHNASTTSTATATEASTLMSVPSQQQQQPPTHLQHGQQVGAQGSSQPPQDNSQQQAQQQNNCYPSEHDHHHDHQGNRTYIDLTNDHGRTPPTSIGYDNNPQYPAGEAQGYNTSGNVNYAGNGAKPYRPWGAEMAY